MRCPQIQAVEKILNVMIVYCCRVTVRCPYCQGMVGPRPPMCDTEQVRERLFFCRCPFQRYHQLAYHFKGGVVRYCQYADCTVVDNMSGIRSYSCLMDTTSALGAHDDELVVFAVSGRGDRGRYRTLTNSLTHPDIMLRTCLEFVHCPLGGLV